MKLKDMKLFYELMRYISKHPILLRAMKLDLKTLKEYNMKELARLKRDCYHMIDYIEEEHKFKKDCKYYVYIPIYTGISWYDDWRKENDIDKQ